MHDELTVADAGVDPGMVDECLGDGPHDERQVGEAAALGGLPCGAVRTSGLLDPAVVDLHGREDVGRGRPGGDHVLGRPPADRRERLDVAGMVAQVLLDIVPGDAPAEAGSGNPGGIQAVVGQQRADDGRQQPGPARRTCRSGGRRACRRGCRHFGRHLGTRRRGLYRRRCALRLVAGDHLSDLHGRSFGGDDLGEDPGEPGRDLGIDLVGGDLVEHVVGLDPVAGPPGPAGDGALGDGLAELGEPQVGHVRHPCSDRPVNESTVSPNSSLSVGWGWMNAATSSTVASQLTAR